MWWRGRGEEWLVSEREASAWHGLPGLQLSPQAEGKPQGHSRELLVRPEWELFPSALSLGAGTMKWA